MNSQIEWYENNITHLWKLKKFINSYNIPSLNEVIYRSQLGYINALQKGKQYKEALSYFRRLEKLPFLKRKKYMRRVARLFVNTLMKK